MTKLANDAAVIVGGGRPIQSIYNAAVQNVAVQAAHAESAAFAATTTVIRIVATSACYYLIGKAPVATTANGSYLPAGIIEFPQVCRGDIISVIRATADGTLNITEGA